MHHRLEFIISAYRVPRSQPFCSQRSLAVLKQFEDARKTGKCLEGAPLVFVLCALAQASPFHSNALDVAGYSTVIQGTVTRKLSQIDYFDYIVAHLRLPSLRTIRIQVPARSVLQQRCFLSNFPMSLLVFLPRCCRTRRRNKFPLSLASCNVHRLPVAQPRYFPRSMPHSFVYPTIYPLSPR